MVHNRNTRRKKKLHTNKQYTHIQLCSVRENCRQLKKKTKTNKLKRERKRNKNSKVKKG